MADLVVDARRGDVSAVEELCARYQARLTQVAGSAGSDNPDTVVEKALTQAMLATKGNPMSDTVAFERDVFARVLAAVVPVDELRDDEEEPEPSTIDTHPSGTHWRNVGLRPEEDEEANDAWNRFDAATIGRPDTSWWSTWTVPILGAVVVIGLLVGGALLLVQPGSEPAAEVERPVGAIVDGVRTAGDTEPGGE